MEKSNINIKYQIYSSDGVPHDSQRVLEMAQQLSVLKNAQFAGIYTHSGASYHCKGAEEIKEHCATAWGKMVELANRLVGSLCLVKLSHSHLMHR